MSFKSNFTNENTIVCQLCCSSENDIDFYGRKNVSMDLAVHNYCCLFSCGLYQNGDEEDEMQGFLIEDIRKEINRARKLRCCFCKKLGASIGCCIRTCKIKYHYNCGLVNNIFFEYYDQYRSYCKKHKPNQQSNLFKLFDFATNVCDVCLGNFDEEDMDFIISATCCKNSFFHKTCIQNYALSSGVHYFKCPKCNNTETFKQEMLFCGIALPDRDAKWEKEASYFRNQENLRYICDVKECKSNRSRDENLLDTEWEIMRCDDCGYNGTHLRCSNLNTPMDPWICHECASLKIDDNMTQSSIDQSNNIDTVRQSVKMNKSSNPVGFYTSDLQKNKSAEKKKQVDIRSYFFKNNGLPLKAAEHIFNQNIEQAKETKLDKTVSEDKIFDEDNLLTNGKMHSPKSPFKNKNTYQFFNNINSRKLYNHKTIFKYSNSKYDWIKNAKIENFLKISEGINKEKHFKNKDILMKFALLTGDIKLLPNTKIFCVL